MPKSKYPQSLDTSVELPAVRDSVLSDPINSLRSAVIQIERTLGVNPQGTAGNTLASRLNRVLDGNGNLLPEAFTQAGLLSGPISNSDVSDNAAIAERKLNLNFPTQILQDEISMLQSDIDTVASQIAELSVKIATHISPDAINRHPGTAISLVTGSATASDTATLDLESSEVQDAFDVLYNQHINYTGANISATNNSHLAEQIYFDNSNVSGVISADNVQDAIETVSGSGANEKNIHQDVQHSNGLLRVGKLESPGDDEISEILASEIGASFSASNGNANGTFTITLNDAVDLTDYELRPFDFVKIEDPADTDELYTGVFEIKEYSKTGSNLDTIECYGYVGSDSTSGTTVTIGKNIARRTNQASLLLGVTEEATSTSARFLRLSNPDANRIFSRNINPLAITATNRYINLTIDSTTYNLDAYNGSIARQTLDSIIRSLNEQLTEEAAHAIAYRVDFEDGGSELVIVHDIPDETSETHTLSVSRSTDNGIDALGFGYIEDVTTDTLYGSKYFLNGETYSGLKEKIDSTELVFFSGSNQIGIGNSSIDFIDSGVRVGDLVIITGANDSSDDGSYLINQVTSTQIRINTGQLPSGFTDISVIGETRIRIYANSLSVNSITFDQVSGTFGATLLDIFMDKNRDIYFSKLLEYNSVISSATSLIEIVDIEGDNFYESTLTINASQNVDDFDAFFLDIDGGDPINITGERKYVWLASHDQNIRLKLYIPDAASIGSKILADGTGFSITVYLLGEVNKESNMLLGRIGYNNFNGRLAGGFYAPRSLFKAPIGTLNTKDFASIARKEIVERPLSELRYNGVIYGFEIENISIDANNFYNFDVRRGVCYVDGRRIEKSTVTSIVTDIDATSVDKIYLVIDFDGNFQIESAIPASCITPFGESDFAIIGSVEYDGVNLEYIDLRLFIDHLDLKLLNSVTVSPQKGMGHFDDVIKGLKYTKRFSEMFPDAETPILHLKSGLHTVQIDYNWGESSITWDPTDSGTLATYYDQQIESGFWIDFPVTIEGEGQSTVVQLIDNSTFTDTSYELTMPICIVGNGFAAATRGHDTLGSGKYVTIRDLRLRQTRISFLDYNIKNGGEDVRYGTKIENVIFGYQGFAGNFIDGTNGPRAIEILEISNTSTDKGNIRIEGCTFVKCGIHTDEVTRTKNINILNNSIIDDDDSTNFLLKNLYGFGLATSGSNITISGNQYTTNTSPNGGGGPEMVVGGTLGWGERFDRDIRVGHDGYIGNDMVVTNDTYSTNYLYNTPKTRTKYFWMSDLVLTPAGSTSDITAWSDGSESSNSYNILNRNLNSLSGADLNVPYATWPAVNNNLDFRVIRFKIPELPVGASITSASIGYGGVDSGTNITFTLYSLSSNGGDGSVTDPITQRDTDTVAVPSIFPLGTIRALAFDITATVSTSVGYVVEINHDDTDDNIDLYWISFTYEISDVISGM